MKKGMILMLGLCLILIAAALPVVSSCDTTEEMYTVCITQIATHPDLDNNRQGIIDGMAEMGYVEGENVEFVIRNPEGDMTTQATIAEYFVSLNPDIIQAITTPSAQTVVAAAEGTDIVIIFSSVTDPVTAGLVPSWTEAGATVTGVSDWFEMPPQIELILSVMPDVQVLGIAYNAGEVNAAVQAEEFKAAAADFGLTVVEATAASTADVYAAGMSLVGRCDAVWIPTCNTVGGVGIESIIQVGEENGLPVFGSALGMISTGLVGGCSVDYYWVGVQAGYMAARILDGEDIADILPIKAAVSTIVYPAAALRMGITIPQSVIDAADLVLED
ncbi:MAG: ABC transporter substrate-binding protein [Dehalococcoidales bacterium]|jgi:putative ABC transport system substrate-binding protein|nr:ABC transporter substrate-binding protein [Dehalococcoidales bacterium]